MHPRNDDKMFLVNCIIQNQMVGGYLGMLRNSSFGMGEYRCSYSIKIYEYGFGLKTLAMVNVGFVMSKAT